MPTFFGFYLAALFLTCCVGLTLYYVLGGDFGFLLRRVFGDRVGYVWGRSFRLMLVLTALAGGFSTQWHGCHGYSDYRSLEKNPDEMMSKATQQLSSSLQNALIFVVAAAGLGAICYAVVCRDRPED